MAYKVLENGQPAVIANHPTKGNNTFSNIHDAVRYATKWIEPFVHEDIDFMHGPVNFACNDTIEIVQTLR